MKRPIGEILRVNLRVTIAVLIALVGFAAIAFFVAIPTHRAEITFAAAVVGGCATVYAAYYAGATLRTSLNQRRKDNAFDIIQTFLAIDTTTVRTLIDKEIQDKTISPKQLYDKIVNDSQLLAGVTALCGQFETVSIAVQDGYADEEVLYYALSFLVPWAFYGLRHYIEETRKVDDSPELYIELEKLAHAWREHKALTTGDVFPPSRGRRLFD